jgi:hypothetical protein
MAQGNRTLRIKHTAKLSPVINVIPKRSEESKAVLHSHRAIPATGPSIAEFILSEPEGIGKTSKRKLRRMCYP